MKVGVIGLGKMGLAISKRLLDANHTVVGFDINAQAQNTLKDLNGQIVDSAVELAGHVEIIWLMLPAGSLVDIVLQEIKPVLDHQIIVDGGNSFYKDSIKRAQSLQEVGVSYLDCGTSGGLEGERIGFCLMVGGDKNAYEKAQSVFKAVATMDGYAHVGSTGAGHYVKMIHNGIEYGLLQAYGEGFDILKNGEYKELNVEQIAGLWEHGSIIRSWILSLTHEVLKKDSNLDNISGEIAQSGMGKWTVELADKEDIKIPVIKAALKVRDDSKQTKNFGTKLVAMLRNAFGGHSVDKQ